MRVLLAAVVPLTSYFSPLTGQAAPQRTAFEQLRDSLATSSDTALLRTKLQRISDGSDGQAVPSAELRAGLIGLRLGELRADPDFSDALTSFRRAARLSTIVIALPGRLTKKEYLVGRAQLTLPAGHWRYRAALQQGDSAGVVLPLGTVRVAATDGTALSLSDIALGTPRRAVSWVTDAADTVLLAPSELFRKGAEIEIYYEASGAAPLERYRHEISVLPWNTRGSKRRPLVSLSFEEVAAGEVIRSRRTLRLERLKPGNYVVEVKVTAPDGSFQVRQRAIRLIEP